MYYFGQDPNFMPMDMHNFANCIVAIRVTALSSQAHIICFFSIFLSSYASTSETVTIATEVQFPCNFLFVIWLSLQMLPPVIEPFIFRILGYIYPLVEHGQNLCTIFI